MHSSTTPGHPQRIAVFDLDWTLLEEISAETLWVIYLIRHRIVPFKNILVSILRLIVFLPFGIDRAVLKNRYYMKEMSVRSVKNLMENFYNEMIQPGLSKDLIERMRQLKSQGYRILLLSATLDFILEHLVRQLNADGGISSTLEIRDGNYTGHIIGTYPYYTGKVTCLESLLGDMQIDFGNSFAFGDTWADIPLLARFGKPVAVHPDVLLKVVAEKRVWEIVQRKVKRKIWPVRCWLNLVYRPVFDIHSN